MKKWYSVGTVGAFSLLLTGCPTKTILVEADPADAAIFINGEKRGRGQISLDVPQYVYFVHSTEVEVRREGFKSMTARLKLDLDWWRALGGSGLGLLFAVPMWALTIGIQTSNVGSRDPVLLALFSTVSVIGIIPVLDPWLYNWKYRPSYYFELEKTSATNN